MQLENRYFIVRLLIFTISITSCTEATLQYKNEDTTGVLYVHPQWAEHEWNHTLYTHLYQTKGVPVDMETAPFEYVISVESGTYSIISHNTNVSGVLFTDLNDYHQAKATAIRIDQTKTDGKELYPSGNAYRLATGEILVPAGKETHIYPPVYLLTKTFVLRFEVMSIDKFRWINGALCGVYYAVYLATGQPVGNDTEWKIPFEIEISEDNTATATIHILGIYDPADGANYQNIMPLQLEDDEGNTYLTDIDLNEVLTDILDHNDGEIPIDIPVEVEVELEVVDGNLRVTVKPWEEGKGVGEIK